MDDPARNSYDEVAYPSRAQSMTHPDRLATIAALFGVETAPVARCRVLEIGCGDGTNLLSMACGLPGSDFLGIDLAAKPIAEGSSAIGELGLSNIRLEQRDLLEFNDAGEFDYIVAHGVYSWVPEPIRDRILAVCAAHLSPRGVAYVSYNAYPGCHIRDLARGMMRFHIRNLESETDRIAQARALLKFIAGSNKEPDLYRMILEKELERAEDYSDGAFFHDDLSPHWHPVYFHEFVGHAAAHGLQFLWEAKFNEVDPDTYKPETLLKLRDLESDPLTREQYLDFLMCRRFRRTLLCHREIELDHRLVPHAVTRLCASSRATAVSEKPDLVSACPESFKGDNGASVELNNPVQKAALWHLTERSPQAIPFPELRATARRLAGCETSEDDHTLALCQFLLRTYAAGVVELRTWSPPVVATVSARPVASPLARLESRSRERISTIPHIPLELTDPLVRHLVGLLDGTRDLAQLAEAMATFVADGKTDLLRDGAPLTDPADIRKTIEAGLPGSLERLARAGVLIG